MSGAQRQPWDFVPLAAVTEKIGSGATPKGGSESYKESGIALIRSLNVHDLDFRFENLARIDEDQATQLANVTVERSDVLLNITGASIARCAVVPNEVLPARVNQHVSILRPVRSRLDSKFLAFFLVSDEAKSTLLGIGSGAGSTRQALTKRQLEEFLVPVPSIDEQRRIVARLDQAFAALDRARANAAANLMDVSELEMRWTLEFLSGLDGASRSLESVCDIYQPKTIATQAMIPDGRYVVFGANGKIGRYNEYNHADSEVLVTCRGATCGRVNVSEPFSWVTGNAMVVRPKTDELRKDFLEEILRSSVDWSEVITGAAQPQITRASLSPVEVLIPDVRMQEEAVGKMKTLRLHVSKLREMSQAKIANIAALRQSLLQAAFSGQLR